MPAGHIIVCGLGHVGSAIVRLLRALELQVVVVTRAAREDWLRVARGLGAEVIIGDARDEALLQRAGLPAAAGLIAATDQDIVNIEIALDARRQRPDLPLVLRLFDQHLGRSLEQGLMLRRALGVSTLVAPAFAAAVTGANLLGAFTFAGTRYLVGRVTPHPGSALAEEERPLRETAARHHALALSVEEPLYISDEEHFERLLERAQPPSQPQPLRLPRPRVPGARRGRRWQSPLSWIRHGWRSAPAGLRATFLVLLSLIGISVFVFSVAMDLSLVDALYFIITTVTTTGYGDITPRAGGPWLTLYACALMLLGSAMTAVLYSFVTDLLISERLRVVLGRPQMPSRGHVIVVGLGNVGYRVVQKLLEAGQQVVSVNSDGAREFLPAVRAEAPVIIGDARLPGILREAGVERAAALIAATGDEAVNLGVALAAKAQNPSLRTVARLFAADLATKVQRGLRVDAALSASMLAAPMFVATLLDEGVREAFLAEDALLSLCDRPVQAAWVGLSPAQVQERFGVQVVLRGAQGAHELALADDPLQEGERLLVLVRRPLRELKLAKEAGA